MTIVKLPAFLMLLIGACMFLLSKYLPIGQFSFFGQSILGNALFALAVIVMLVSVVQMQMAKTTISPTNPERTTSLITNGVFKFSRNPIYLGMLIFLLAVGVRLSNAFNILFVWLFIRLMNNYQIKKEEGFLLEKFGKDYRAYQKAVRRWF